MTSNGISSTTAPATAITSASPYPAPSPAESASDWDVVIVGAGPAGMAAALYTGRAKLKTLLLDRAGMGGGQLMNTELIEDYPAIKSITGSDMALAFEDQIREFGVEITYG